MAGTELALASDTALLSTFEVMGKAHELATSIARTEFVPAAFRGKPEAVMACVLAGHEMGVTPMQALAKIHVIEGRPAPSAELMRAVVLSRGHEVWVEESSTTRVTLAGRRRDSDHTTKVTWTIDDARRAKLDGKAVWRSYPRAMLMARATGELVRAVFPDVMAGLTYAAEEVQDGFIDDQWVAEPEPVEEEAPANLRSLPVKKAVAKKAAVKRAPAKKAAVKKAAPGPASAAADLPALPGEEDDIVDAEVVEQPDQDDQKRAQQIAMRARDVGVDHHDVVYAVTGGRATSAKGLSDADHDAVREALRLIKTGAKVLDDSGDEPVLRDAPEPESAEVEDGDGPDLGEVDEWDADQWRAWLRDRGVKVVAAVRAAQRLAADAGLEPPASLEGLKGTSLAVLLAGWVEDGAP